jgi:hypothetical protein
MHSLLVAAAVIATVTGFVHSLLGERLIFRHLRASSLVPSLPAPPLQSRHVRILWATWHLASVLLGRWPECSCCFHKIRLLLCQPARCLARRHWRSSPARCLSLSARAVVTLAGWRSLQSVSCRGWPSVPPNNSFKPKPLRGSA